MDQPTPAAITVDDEPDAAIVLAARQGDRIAQAAFLRGIQDRLFRVCRALMPDATSTEDAVQETALRVLTHLPTFTGESRLTTWATGISVNVCREHRRKLRFITPPPRHAFVETADVDALDALHAALADLPERQREAVVLRYLEGLTVKQTAELMGVAEGTVKATVHAGLRKLRELLDDET